MRLPGTINQKDGSSARIIYEDEDEGGEIRRFDFRDVCGQIFDFTPEQCRVWKEQRAAKQAEKARKAKPRSKNALWTWYRNIASEIEARVVRNEGAEPGTRMHHLLLWLCALALGGVLTSPDDVDEQAEHFASLIPDWSYCESELSTFKERLQKHLAGETVRFAGNDEASPLYTYGTDRMIELLGVKEEERILMPSLCGFKKPLSQRREEWNVIRRKHKDRPMTVIVGEKLDRKAEAERLSQQGNSTHKIAEILKVSVRSVQRYLAKVAAKAAAQVTLKTVATQAIRVQFPAPLSGAATDPRLSLWVPRPKKIK